MTHLSSGIDDVAVVLGALVVDAFGEGIFDCRVIRFNKVALCILNDKRGLP
jgi:hypothetical protein